MLVQLVAEVASAARWAAVSAAIAGVVEEAGVAGAGQLDGRRARGHDRADVLGQPDAACPTSRTCSGTTSKPDPATGPPPAA